MLKICDLITCRQTLYIMCTTGAIINGMLASIMSICIVYISPSDSSGSSPKWTESQKQTVIGIFYWGYAVSKFPSGRLAEVFGSRVIVGYSVFLAGIVTVMMPFLIQWNYYSVLVSRIVMGVLLGTLFPSQGPLCTKWAPSTSLAKFVACLEGVGLGTALVYLFGGLLTAFLDWTSVFYFTGCLSLLWGTLWFYLVYDTPEQHPRISTAEKNKIGQEIGPSRISVSRIPFKSILTSGAVWAIFIANTAFFFVTITLQNEIPTYLDHVFQISDAKIGMLSSLSVIGRYVFGQIFAVVGDYLLTSGKLSKTTVRKLFESMGLFVPALLMFAAAFTGGYLYVIVTIFMVASAVSPACVVGHMVNILDIAPNFSGTIAGLIYGFGALMGALSPTIVAIFIEGNHTFEQWKFIFYILAGVNVVGGIVFLKGCSTEVQIWNSEQGTI